MKENYKEEIVVKLILEKRKLLAKSGGRKIFNMLQADFKKFRFKIGRDKFFDILRKNSLLIKPKRKYTRTTNSNHWFKKYKNLIKELSVDKINQVFVSDITYIRVGSKFAFLSLITDLYSRKIVGYALHPDLTANGPLLALKMALKSVSDPSKLIHHSDRGIQYCCDMYTKLLLLKKVKISMTEENHVYENAVAERVNGILKGEFSMGTTFKSLPEATKAIKEAVILYNTVRPHLSLNYLTPEQKYVA